MIRASIEKLGFKYSDVRILLISHAHWDHDAGSALIKQQTGASYMVMQGDVPVVESGGTTDFNYGSDKGTLYKILRNRTYLGEAVRKGKSYAGEHKPIVDRATWDRVDEVLASNARRRGNEARARTPDPARLR